MSDLSAILGSLSDTATDAHGCETTSIVLDNPARTYRLDAMFAEHFRIPRRPTLRVTANHALKRLLDLVVAVAGLLLLWPAMLLAGIATLWDTGRPITYSQIRRIRFGRRARIYKMRTLVNGADRRLGALVNIKHNGRFLNIDKAASSYTRVGRYLERLWIVELPQLWNVLRGQMSLVGNRPIPDYVIDALGPAPEVLERFASPQGLTGYAQVIGRDNLTDNERIRLEYQYSRIFEEDDVFLEDLRIIALTAMCFFGIGRRRTAADFLKDSHVSTAVAQALVTRPAHAEEAISVSVREADRSGSSAGLACPTCYVVEDTCGPDRCEHQCVASCRYDALRLNDRSRPVFLDACVACSACVVACPLRAIDKAPLEAAEDGSLRCVQCGAEYAERDGVIDLLPKRANLEQNPYFEFYDKEYVRANPQIHLEDTDWKLRELRPMLDPPGTVRRLLDVGCGAGVLGQKIADELKVADRTATDWSSEILSFALQRDGNGTHVRTDAAYLPFRNGAFDLAMLIDVIEHQQKPDHVLRELQRVARHLLLRTPLEDCLYERMRRRHKDLFRESSGHVVHFNPGSIQARLLNDGWSVRRQSIRHISWTHWRRYVFGHNSLKTRCSSLARVALRFILPKPVFRRVFVTNYNALCDSRFFISDGERESGSERRDDASRPRERKLRPLDSIPLPTHPGSGERVWQMGHQAKIAIGARTRDRVYTGPLYVQVGVVNACNYRCQFCWDHPTFVSKESPYPDRIAEKYYKEHPEIDRNCAHMDWDLFTGLVDDLHEMGTRKIKFVGRGEPFLHKRFVEMVAYAKRKGFNCSITTNGSLISDEQVRTLVGTGLDEIFVSVNAASPKTYSEIHLHTPPGAFDRIKRTLRLLASEKARLGTARPVVHLSLVIQNNNYFEMPDMVRLTHEVGAQRAAFVRASAYEGTEFLRLNPMQDTEVLEKYAVEAEELGHRLGIATNLDLFRSRPGGVERSKSVYTATPCYIGWYFSIILADGTVNPCCECLRAIGTLKTQRFRDIWFSEAYREFRSETRNLPTSGKEIRECRCYNCGFASHNLSMHRFVHPLSHGLKTQSGFGPGDLKRFIFG